MFILGSSQIQHLSEIHFDGLSAATLVLYHGDHRTGFHPRSSLDSLVSRDIISCEVECIRSHI
jgi:hypothetical protein